MSGTESRSGGNGDTVMPQIVKTEDVLGGDPRIEGHRIGVHHVYQRYIDNDETPEEIAVSYDISVAEVHTALAYAFSNSTDMRDIERRNREVYEQGGANRVIPNKSA